MKKEFAIYRRTDVVVLGGRLTKEFSFVDVRVMARAEGYAMVRRKGAAPFVVSEKDLEPKE